MYPAARCIPLGVRNIFKRQAGSGPSMINAWFILYGAVLGIFTGYSKVGLLLAGAQHVGLIFKNMLELISIPIIFLSITATVTRMKSGRDAAYLGLRVLRYTIATTLISASIGLFLFLLVRPNGTGLVHVGGPVGVVSQGVYLSFLLGIIPSNVVQAFSSSSNVTSVVFLALLVSGAILTLPSEEKELLHRGFSALFSAMLAITQFIIVLMPIGVWAFVAQFVQALEAQRANLMGLGLYVVVVLGANIIQGFVVLPFIVWMRGLRPLTLMQAFKPALVLAFFSKSSNTALPVTIQCAEQRAGISPKVSRFVLPLCSTINMNGCAAFILITILFIGTSYGMIFSWLDMLVWLIVATIAAVGNAGVPMGCFFLTSAFLAHMQLPLHMMGVIFPIYAILDMVETALNVWSDSCVAAMVDTDISA